MNLPPDQLNRRPKATPQNHALTGRYVLFLQEDARHHLTFGQIFSGTTSKCREAKFPPRCRKHHIRAVDDNHLDVDISIRKHNYLRRADYLHLVIVWMIHIHDPLPEPTPTAS